MSTIKIKGYASRKVNADIIRYRITFIAKDMKVSKASERVKSQCDIFLRDMKKIGFDISKFHLDKDVVEKEYNREEKKVSRTVSIETVFDPKINNVMFSIIKDNDLNVETETDFFVSDVARIQEELLKEALLESKKKAELIAEANNQKVKYADQISDDKHDNNYDYYKENLRCGDALDLDLKDDSLSAELSAKQMDEYAYLYVTWVIE